MNQDSNSDIPFLLVQNEESKKKKKTWKKVGFFSHMFSRKVKDVSIEQRLTLSPIEKFTKYGRLPIKLILHSLLLLCITLQVVLFTWHRQPYLGTMGNGFATTFLPDGYETLQDNTEGFYTYYFHSINETFDHIQNIVNIYDTFVKDAPDTFVYLPKDFKSNYNVKRPIRARAVLYATSIRDVLNITSNVNYFSREPYTTIIDELTVQNPRGTPGKLLDYVNTEEQLRDFFDRLKELELSFHLQSLDTSAVGPFSIRIGECIQWNLSFLFDHRIRGGRLPLKMLYDFSECQNTQVSFTTFFVKFCKPYVWFATLVFILSIISLLLTLKSILHRFSLFRRLRRMKKLTSTKAHKESNLLTRLLAWLPLFSRHVSVADIPSFMDVWNLITLFSDCLNIITGLLHFYIRKEGDVTSFFMGLSVLLNYVHMMRYLQYYPKYYVLVLTLRKAIPSIVRFFIGTIPLFLAFAMCGTVIFGQYADYFQDLDDASVTLFSLLNGDAIHDVFDMLFGNSEWIGYLSRVYIYAFVLLFICGVLNIFILIMEDAYFSVNSSSNYEQNIEDFINKLDDDDIEDIMQYEKKKQEAFDQIEKEDGITLDYVMNEESLEDNIERLRKFVSRFVENSSDTDVKDALPAFDKITESLTNSIKKKRTERGESHLDRLVQRSQNVFSLNVREEHQKNLSNPNMDEVSNM